MDPEELLDRKLTREVKARQEAERLLEDKSNELYQARVRAEAAEAALTDALRSLDDGLLLFDQEGKLILANRRFYEIYPEAKEICQPGMEEGELWHAIITRGAFTSGSRRLPAPGGGGDKSGGSDRWERITASGKFVCIIEQETEAGQRISVHRDISDIRAAESQLQWRLAAIEEAADGIAITDQLGLFDYANAAYARLLKYGDAAELIDKSWRSLYDSEERDRLESEILPILRDFNTWSGKARALDSVGTHIDQELSLNLLPGGGILWVMRDVTEELRAKAEQRRVMQRLYEAERMEAVGQLARVVAHDFNNVLAAISAFQHALEGDQRLSNSGRDLLGKIGSAVGHAEGIIKRLQASESERSLTRGRVDLVRLARDTSDMVRATLEPDQALRLRASRPSIPVLGDHAQLGQMVLNFLVNAREALGKERGSIEVTISEISAASDLRGDWQVSATRGHQPSSPVQACLAVEDSGCGMTQEVIERAFEADFSTKGGESVRGLGLSAAESVAHAHDGLIALHSTPGYGTRAQLVLPRYRMNLPSSARILVVDDDPLAGEGLVAMLESQGHRADLLDAPEEALGLIEDDPAIWDLVVSDQQMPIMEGTQLAERCLAIRPDLPIIIFTGLRRSLGLLPGNVVGVLRKPVDLDALQSLLAE
ncbi:MAG: PAS-domain containing protein [Kiloniellales bacterium]